MLLLSLHLCSAPGDAGEKGDKGDKGEDGVGIKGSPGAPGAPGEAFSGFVAGFKLWFKFFFFFSSCAVDFVLQVKVILAVQKASKLGQLVNVN